MTHWRRHDECVVETFDTYADDDQVSGHGAHAVNATACGRLASHGDTTSRAQEADCEECVAIAEFVRFSSLSFEEMGDEVFKKVGSVKPADD
jgi:hypothetical protein